MRSQKKMNLLDLSYANLVDLVVEWGEPRFRATQIWHWVYDALVDNAQEMSNLPRDLRQRVTDALHIGRLRVVDTLKDDKGLTEKLVFETSDGRYFESVLMRYPNRNTVCVSSQIGCALGCLFCATGRGGYERDLSTGEISAQILHFARQLRDEDANVTNVVFMGMGEPMLNFDAVWQSILNLNDERGLGLGARRFTISTAGIVPGIERIARESLAVGLAVSLHAPNDELRGRIVPVNRRYPLARLLEATGLYIERTGRRVTFEYVLADGLNDSEECAHQLVELLAGHLCHVNLIPLNPVAGCEYQPSPVDRVVRFQEILVEGRIQTTVRASRGSEIGAACGQLRQRYSCGQN